ncbi:RNA 2',3'-cyclic phosphodiesterase [Aciduricibacillus chroicocephali]|uniref:RNA 2',3'-cyclic phosphodiesterase n=1 Tax=Aciduricibacillus chroicocephali TaxID=3054939 RepID=A0ABY9KSE6_9BACI|nr:RNA 2',3'-cyclic phosphodiesterase [Bacillaceae bacterium 44XB]
MQSSHYFIGIHIPEAYRSELVDQQQELKKEFQYKNWTGTDDFHITLKFLGAVEPNTLEKLIEACLLLEFPPSFQCQLNELGSFGKSTEPRVLFREVEKHPNLLKLQAAFEKTSAEFGYPPEKRTYNPHVTIGKKFLSATAPVNEILERTKRDHLEFEVQKAVLFRIEPQQNPRYVPIAKFHLKGGEHHGAVD